MITASNTRSFRISKLWQKVVIYHPLHYNLEMWKLLVIVLVSRGFLAILTLTFWWDWQNTWNLKVICLVKYFSIKGSRQLSPVWNKLLAANNTEGFIVFSPPPPKNFLSEVGIILILRGRGVHMGRLSKIGCERGDSFFKNWIVYFFFHFLILAGLYSCTILAVLSYVFIRIPYFGVGTTIMFSCRYLP